MGVSPLARKEPGAIPAKVGGVAVICQEPKPAKREQTRRQEHSLSPLSVSPLSSISFSPDRGDHCPPKMSVKVA